MSNLQSNCCLKIDFQKVDQHAGGKWLIHDTKCRKANQLQSLKLRWNKLSVHISVIGQDTNSTIQFNVRYCKQHGYYKCRLYRSINPEQ